MNPSEKKALSDELLGHIWYTTKTDLGSSLRPRSTFVRCKCFRRFADSDDHALHVTSVALKFLGIA